MICFFCLVITKLYLGGVLVSTKKSQLKSHYNVVFRITFHLVLVTKYRRKVLSQPILNHLEAICTDLCEKWDIDLTEFGGEADHIHLLLEMHPNIQPSKFVNNLKTVSSRLIRKEFGSELSKYYWKPVLWTRAYCLLSAGGAPLDIIKEYIENQGRNSSPSKLAKLRNATSRGRILAEDC